MHAGSVVRRGQFLRPAFFAQFGEFVGVGEVFFNVAAVEAGVAKDEGVIRAVDLGVPGFVLQGDDLGGGAFGAFSGFFHVVFLSSG